MGTFCLLNPLRRVGGDGPTGVTHPCADEEPYLSVLMPSNISAVLSDAAGLRPGGMGGGSTHGCGGWFCVPG